MEKITEKYPAYQAIGPQRPTHYPPNGGVPDVLDIAVLKDIAVPTDIQTSEGGDAHEPIILTVGEGPRVPERMKKKTNWTKFRRIAGQVIGPINEINNAETLEEQVCFFEEALTEALERSTTTSVADKYGKFKNIDDDLKNLISEKNRITRRARRTRNSDKLRRVGEIKEEIQGKLREHGSEECNKINL